MLNSGDSPPRCQPPREWRFQRTSSPQAARSTTRCRADCEVPASSGRGRAVFAAGGGGRGRGQGQCWDAALSSKKISLGLATCTVDRGVRARGGVARGMLRASIATLASAPPTTSRNVVVHMLRAIDCSAEVVVFGVVRVVVPTTGVCSTPRALGKSACDGQVALAEGISVCVSQSSAQSGQLRHWHVAVSKGRSQAGQRSQSNSNS